MLRSKRRQQVLFYGEQRANPAPYVLPIRPRTHPTSRCNIGPCKLKIKKYQNRKMQRELKTIWWLSNEPNSTIQVISLWL